MNKPNENYCKAVSHKQPFEGLPTKCDGGATIMRHKQIFKRHS